MDSDAYEEGWILVEVWGCGLHWIEKRYWRWQLSNVYVGIRAWNWFMLDTYIIEWGRFAFTDCLWRLVNIGQSVWDGKDDFLARRHHELESRREAN
jgi:hypothetical protein